MENGILVKVGDVDELASAMEFILDNPAIAEGLGQNALEIATELNPKEIISQWNNYIDSVLAVQSTNRKFREGNSHEG
jgi:glycosyltransferase involved in cell wall biosynthesis